MKITHITEHYMYPMIKLMMDTSKFKNDLGISANSSVLYALNLAHVNLHIEDMDLFDYFVMNQISPIRELTHRIDRGVEITDICNQQEIQYAIYNLKSRISNFNCTYNMRFSGIIKLPLTTLLNISSNNPEVIISNVLKKDNTIDIDILTDNILKIFVPYYHSYFNKTMNTESDIISEIGNLLFDDINTNNKVSLISVSDNNHSIAFKGVNETIFNNQLENIKSISSNEYSMVFAIRCSIEHLHLLMPYIVAWDNVKLTYSMRNRPSNTAPDAKLEDYFNTFESVINNPAKRIEYSMLKYHVIPSLYNMNIIVKISSSDMDNIFRIEDALPTDIVGSIIKYYNIIDNA